MITIKATRRFQFCAGHRVHKHESKCNNMHGHNYVMVVYAEAPELDALGRVIDFSEIKRIIGEWIDIHWDHGFMVYNEDKEVLNALSTIPRQKIYIMTDNPTAENMGRYLIDVVFPYLFKGTGIEITKLILWETENCSVEVVKSA